MEKIYTFYVLSASSDVTNIRYVGVTTRTVQQRFYGHKYCAMNESKRTLPVHKWMFSHYEKGEDIIFKQIDSCNQNEWENREKYWISYYKDLGFDLLNVLEGGQGVITKEMRELSSVERSKQKHEKPIIALHKNGTFYKEFESITKASEELNIKNKSSISNALKGRSKSSGGYLWVYKDNYNANNQYDYTTNTKRTKIYQFDLNGILIQSFPSKRYFDSLDGWSYNGIQTAIKDKKLYHNFYWSEFPNIDVNEYEPYFKYQEINSKKEVVAMYHDYTEISKKFNVSTGVICKKVNKQIPFNNGNIISKL